jgi:hypothetical protein
MYFTNPNKCEGWVFAMPRKTRKRMVGKRDEKSELRQRELLFVGLRQMVRRDRWTAQSMVRRWPWDAVLLAAEGTERQAS